MKVTVTLQATDFDGKPLREITKPAEYVHYRGDSEVSVILAVAQLLESKKDRKWSAITAVHIDMEN